MTNTQTIDEAFKRYQMASAISNNIYLPMKAGDAYRHRKPDATIASETKAARDAYTNWMTLQLEARGKKL